MDERERLYRRYGALRVPVELVEPGKPSTRAEAVAKQLGKFGEIHPLSDEDRAKSLVTRRRLGKAGEYYRKSRWGLEE